MENQFIANQETNNFFNIIKGNLESCLEFKICVSFIRVSGAQLLLDLLQDLENLRFFYTSEWSPIIA